MKNLHAVALGKLGGATKGPSKARTKEQASKAGNTPCRPGLSRGRPKLVKNNSK